MTQHRKDKEEARNIRNLKRLSTLKLWQLHLQSLSKPKRKPLLSDYYEDYELTVSTINNDRHENDDEDFIPLFDNIDAIINEK